MRSRHLLTGALSTALIAPLVFVAVPHDVLASSPFAILMGETEVEGGTEKLGQIDPLALPPSGPDATGSVKNEMPKGKVWNDLDFTIKNGTAATVKVGHGPSVEFNEDGNRAHVSVTTSGNASEDYTLDGLEGDGTDELIDLYVSPSDAKTVDGAKIESNILPAFRFDRMSDQARNGVESHHEAVLALVHNDDGSKGMTSIDGEVSFPGTAAANLEDVHLFQADGDPFPYAAVSISGDEFSVTDFGGVATGESVQVLVVLDADLGGELARVRLEADFAP